MNKLFLLLSLSFLVFSCNTDDLDTAPSSDSKKSVSKLNSGENVKLHSAWASYSSKYGYTDVNRKFRVEVRNLAFDKQVDVLCEMTDGTWKFFPLSYTSSTENNSEIWATSINTDSGAPTFKGKFAIRYKVNSQEYWDNNNGNDYEVKGLDGRYLANDVKLSHFSNNFTQYNGESKLYVNVDVQNLNPTKTVEVVYTTDGWNTSAVAPLHFTEYVTVGAAQQVKSPNRFNVEKWTNTITLPNSVNNVEYAIVYKVNGQEYWDNNYGQNYTSTKVIY